jgi:hypothetical protein
MAETYAEAAAAALSGQIGSGSKCYLMLQQAVLAKVAGSTVVPAQRQLIPRG